MMAPGAAPSPVTPRAADLLLDGLTAHFNRGYAAAVPMLRNALRAFGNGPDNRLRTALMSLWLDAFIAGAGYYKLKTEGGQSAPENMEES